MGSFGLVRYSPEGLSLRSALSCAGIGPHRGDRPTSARLLSLAAGPPNILVKVRYRRLADAYQNGPRRGRPWIFDVPKGRNWVTGWIQILVPKWGRGLRLDLSGVLAPAIEPCRTVVEQDQTATLVVNSHVFIEYRSSRMQSAANSATSCMSPPAESSSL